MRALAILAIMVVLAGCGSSRRAVDVEPQGFIGDYSKLTPGSEGEAVLRYVNTGADWAKYDKGLIEPVAVWGSRGADAIPEEGRTSAASLPALICPGTPRATSATARACSASR
jgi:hypothetical protein